MASQWNARGAVSGLATIAAIIVILWPRFADAQPSPLQPQGAIREVINPKEHISGISAAGLVFLGRADLVAPDKLYAYFARPPSTGLHLQMTTVDGRYLGEVRYAAGSGAHGWVPLSFPTEHPDFLSRYSLKEVAVLLTADDGSTIYPVRWGQGAHTDTIRVYVNTERANAYIVNHTQEDGAQVIRCERASASAAFKFNRVCDIPASHVEKNQGVEILRKQGVRRLSPVSIHVNIAPR